MVEHNGRLERGHRDKKMKLKGAVMINEAGWISCVIAAPDEIFPG